MEYVLAVSTKVELFVVPFINLHVYNSVISGFVAHMAVMANLCPKQCGSMKDPAVMGARPAPC